MEIKTYRANSMQEAIALVRRELGPDAAILHTRQAPTGVLGWLSGRQIEVTATLDLPIPSRIEQSSRRKVSPPQRPVAKRPDWAGSGEEKIETGHVTSADTADFRAAYREAIKRKEDDSPSVVEQLSHGRRDGKSQISGTCRLVVQRLADAGFAQSIATDLLKSAVGTVGHLPGDDTRSILATIQFHLAQRIRTVGPIRPTGSKPYVAAIVGPAGVGKTSTVAKLAAQFRLKDKLSVGLVTDDVHRVAAVERLRGYARTLDLPLEVATTPVEMKTAVARLSGTDVVLIDTAGHSPHDSDHLKTLNQMLRAAQVNEVHLAVSAATSESSLRLTAQRFAGVGIDRLLLTKLDETTALGGLYSLLTETTWPVAYATNGQNVPHDIQTVTSAMLAERMIGET